MSKIIPPSKRPTLDSKLLFDQSLNHDKFLSTHSTVLQSPHTPSGSTRTDGQSLIQNQKMSVKSNENTYLPNIRISAF